MDLATLIGIIVAFGSLLTGFKLEGGAFGSLLLLSPAVIVFGGTFGATMISFSFMQLKKVPKLFISAFRSSIKDDITKVAGTLEEMAQLVKVNGFLSLEGYLQQHDDLDPVLQRGVLLMMDGADSQRIEESMESDIAIIEQTKHSEIGIFEAMGGYSPTMGVAGTVMGLVQTLSHMGAPEELAEAIAAAFIATLYGIAMANLLYLPIASKLKMNAKMHGICYELQVKGVVSIQKGFNVRAIKEMITPYLEAVDIPASDIGGGEA
jgi:chemotaxis protein MotA